MNYLNAQLTHLMHLAVRLVVRLLEGQSQGPGIQLIFNKDWLTFSQESRGHDMMHRSVLIIYDQQFMIATITTDHA